MPAIESKVTELALRDQANTQLGLLHRDHLELAGLTRGQVGGRVDCGRLTRVYNNVFAFGHTALRDEARWLAALWSLGRDCALSHGTAAAFHRWRRIEEGEDVHVSTTRCLKDRDDIRVHRIMRLDARDLLRPDGFTVTSKPRTLVDLADVMPWPAYRALADGLPELRVGAIRAALERSPRRRGSPMVRRLIEADDAHTKSEFERRYQRFARAHGLGTPSGVNVWVAGHKVDVVYGDSRLIVELDGRSHHRRRAQMRADRHRDIDYQLAGFLIVRLVWDDLHPDSATQTADRIRRMMVRGADRVP